MFGYTYTYARKDKDGNTVPLCHCDCHFGWEDDRKPRVRPDATQSKLCPPCLEEAMSPWTTTLESLLT